MSNNTYIVTTVTDTSKWANEYKWRFYTTSGLSNEDFDTPVNLWRWAQFTEAGELVAHSQKDFSTLTMCYEDAISNGFNGQTFVSVNPHS